MSGDSEIEELRAKLLNLIETYELERFRSSIINETDKND